MAEREREKNLPKWVKADSGTRGGEKKLWCICFFVSLHKRTLLPYHIPSMLHQPALCWRLVSSRNWPVTWSQSSLNNKSGYKFVETVLKKKEAISNLRAQNSLCLQQRGVLDDTDHCTDLVCKCIYITFGINKYLTFKRLIWQKLHLIQWWSSEVKHKECLIFT